MPADLRLPQGQESLHATESHKRKRRKEQDGTCAPGSELCRRTGFSQSAEDTWSGACAQRAGPPAGSTPQPQTLIWILRLQFPCSDTGRPGAGYADTRGASHGASAGRCPDPSAKQGATAGSAEKNVCNCRGSLFFKAGHHPPSPT